MSRPVITLTTDFGEGSPYVAQMKGAILSINPDVQLVDITHAVPAQDVRQGAIVLGVATTVFPANSVHVAVVDPGVGSDRRIVYARIGQQQFVAPDNGLISHVAQRTRPSQVIWLTNRAFWRTEISNTFHGRDIMAPVAAHLSRGVAPEKLGEPIDDMVQLDVPNVQVASQEIKGMIVSFDSFGNLISDIPASLLTEAVKTSSLLIRCASHDVRRIVPTYSAEPKSSLVALIGSSGMLELAIVNGNAAQTLGVPIGEEVKITW